MQTLLFTQEQLRHMEAHKATMEELTVGMEVMVLAAKKPQLL